MEVNYDVIDECVTIQKVDPDKALEKPKNQPGLPKRKHQ